MLELARQAEAEAINHPAHYTYSSIEPTAVIEAWDLPYHLGCVVKYLCRFRGKGRPLEDLKKARWYLDRYVALVERKGQA